MTINRQIHLKETPEAEPQPDHFSLFEAEMPQALEGQVLCATQYLSLDPYMRSQLAGRHMSGTINPGDLMLGETVSKVIESNHADFKPGDVVRCFGNWQEYSVHEAAELTKIDSKVKSESHALSALGMPGLTAYAGMVWIAKPKAGDVVLIPAAIGGVGSVAGQLAKIHGCKVIGIAGSDEKCQIAVNELGYDACINRKTDDLAAKLSELCPNGVDVYFDLVGGETLNTVCLHLALHARVILCGLMEDYNKSTRTPGPMPGPIIGARATLTGLVVYDWELRRAEFTEICANYIEDGQLKVREDIARGIESAPEAFCRLMRGENKGKSAVRVAVD